MAPPPGDSINFPFGEFVSSVTSKFPFLTEYPEFRLSICMWEKEPALILKEGGNIVKYVVTVGRISMSGEDQILEKVSQV